MDTARKYLKGDLYTWGLILTLMVVSFLPTYSASSSLAHKFSGGNTFTFLTRHMMHLLIGGIFMYAVHRLNFRLIGKVVQLAMPAALILLLITMFQGTEMGDANASRWVRIPVIGMSFQTSAFASLALLIWLAKWFSKTREFLTFKDLKAPLLMIGSTLILILPADFSTTAVIFTMAFIMMAVAGVPWRFLWKIIAAAVVALLLFVLVVWTFPHLSNRIATWKARIVNFMDPNNEEGNYQIELAKMAIAEGEVFGKGPGKSIQKNFLPQSNSDFVFAVITEEYGLFGSSVLIVFYGLLFRRFVKIARRAHTKFGTLLVLAASSGIVLQTIVNMGVAIDLLPVTGQTLPFLSAGGSSVWVTCIALGVILSVSHTDVERIIGTSPQEEEESFDTENTLAHG
ncbi:FtsW/RodA/SpoVE family cell cycle protein [Schleiferiaceae bacterium]|nr:FtsW/RodA/SpoVE family cell cycle protein [Schleiferiaceae bacterium]